MDKIKYGIFTSIVAIVGLSVFGIYNLDADQEVYVQPHPPMLTLSEMIESDTKFDTITAVDERAWIKEPKYMPTDSSLKTITSDGEVVYAIYGNGNFKVRSTIIDNIQDGVVITYSTDGEPSPNWVELAQEKAKQYDHISVSTVNGVSLKLVEDINSEDKYSVNKAYYRDGKNIVVALSKSASIDELEKIIRSIIN